MIRNTLLAALIFLSLQSCYDIVEEDISDQSLELLAPFNGAELTDTEVTFRWSDVEGISGYELLVVKPDFDRIEKVVIDSTLTDERFNYELLPGVYEWRVRAFNSASELMSDIFRLEVVASPEQE